MYITVGADIGQRVDPTAIAVTELVWRESASGAPGARAFEDHHLVRHLERLPLGTSYPAVRDRLAQIVKTLNERVHDANLADRAGWLVQQDYADMRLYLDATGVGKPVVDIMQEIGIKTTGVYFTHGDRRVEDTDESTGEARVMLGKAFLVSRLQALLQTRRIHLPHTDEAQQLAQELLDYEIRVDSRANDTYGAFRVGTHDDLVTALGLTVQRVPHYYAGAASTAPPASLQVPSWAGGNQINAPRLGEQAALPSFGGLNGLQGSPFGPGNR